MKKAEVETQIFLYVMVVVVMGLVLLLGYRFITKLSSQSSTMSLDLFKKDLSDSINTVSTNFGEVDLIELSLPTKYSKVCFVNKAQNPNLESYPLIKSSVDSGASDNVFILSKKIDSSFRTENLVLENGLLCIENNAGVIKLKLESLGNAVKIAQSK